MAKKAKSEPVAVDTQEKIARLLAIQVTKDMSPEDAALKLLAVGFDSPLIGSLLGKNPNFANLARFKSKGKG